MTAMWFGLAAIALIGAVALLYIDRSRRDQSGRLRQMWARAQGYDYRPEDHDLVAQFSRAVLHKPEFDVALGVVTGVRRGEEFVLFDVEETATIVAVQRAVGSDVDIELRPRATPPPRDEDMELLGSIGPRVVFATDLDIARRVCDQRMAAFTESVPANLQLLWSEGNWTLGSLPLGSAGRDWDAAIDSVARLSGMLHVLPPVRGSGGYGARRAGNEPGRDRGDPGRPLPHEPRTGKPDTRVSEHADGRSAETPAPRPDPRRPGPGGPLRPQPPIQASRVPPPRADLPQSDRSESGLPRPRPQSQSQSRPIPFDSGRRRDRS